MYRAGTHKSEKEEKKSKDLAHLLEEAEEENLEDLGHPLEDELEEGLGEDQDEEPHEYEKDSEAGDGLDGSDSSSEESEDEEENQTPPTPESSKLRKSVKIVTPAPKSSKWGVERALAELMSDDEQASCIELAKTHSSMESFQEITSAPGLILLAVMFGGQSIQVVHSVGYFRNAKNVKETGWWGFLGEATALNAPPLLAMNKN